MIPLATFDATPPPFLSSTRTGRIFTSGAAPAMPSPLFDVRGDDRRRRACRDRWDRCDRRRPDSRSRCPAGPIPRGPRGSPPPRSRPPRPSRASPRVTFHAPSNGTRSSAHCCERSGSFSPASSACIVWSASTLSTSGPGAPACSFATSSVAASPVTTWRWPSSVRADDPGVVGQGDGGRILGPGRQRAREQHQRGRHRDDAEPRPAREITAAIPASRRHEVVFGTQRGRLKRQTGHGPSTRRNGANALVSAGARPPARPGRGGR